MRAITGFSIAVVLASAWIAPTAIAQEGWVWVCHRSGKGFDLLIVSANSGPAHAAHGDPVVVPYEPGLPDPICSAD